jgi:hypothetical protein
MFLQGLAGQQVLAHDPGAQSHDGWDGNPTSGPGSRSAADG